MAYATGAIVNIQQIGAGAVTIQGASGVTITSTGATATAPVTRADILKGRGVKLDERDIKGKEERIVKALKKTGKYKEDDPELYRLAAGLAKKNEVYLHIQAEPHVYYELADQFTFDVPNAKFAPAYRNKYWDGKIRLFSTQTGEIYIGLLDRIIRFCETHNYTYEFKNNKFYGLPFEINEGISKEGVKDYMTAISKHPPRDYQIEGVYDALRHNRKLLISPTASGKSLMIYAIVRYYVEKGQNTLIVVPTTSLVEQMYKDFADYGWDVGSYCHKIYAGKERETDSQVIITTWQSIYKLPRQYFSRFNVVVGDEAHQFKSKSLVSLFSWHSFLSCTSHYLLGSPFFRHNLRHFLCTAWSLQTRCHWEIWS